MSDIYSDDANWLCKPGIADDICARDLDATIVHADGTTELEEFLESRRPDVRLLRCCSTGWCLL